MIHVAHSYFPNSMDNQILGNILRLDCRKLTKFQIIDLFGQIIFLNVIKINQYIIFKFILYFDKILFFYNLQIFF